jgi:hypothetical protein
VRRLPVSLFGTWHPSITTNLPDLPIQIASIELGDNFKELDPGFRFRRKFFHSTYLAATILE